MTHKDDMELARFVKPAEQYMLNNVMWSLPALN